MNTKPPIPDRLRQAIAEHHAARPHPLPLSAEVGDLVVVPGAILLVTRIFGEHRQAVLCHSTPDMATDHDVILRHVTPYPLVIGGELYCYIAAADVTGTVGRVGRRVVEAVINVLFTQGESIVEYERGLPLGGMLDPRRRFIESELDRMESFRRIPEEVWGRL